VFVALTVSATLIRRASNLYNLLHLSLSRVSAAALEDWLYNQDRNFYSKQLSDCENWYEMCTAVDDDYFEKYIESCFFVTSVTAVSSLELLSSSRKTLSD